MLITVMIPHIGPPKVLVTSRHDIVAMVADTSNTGSYIATLPPGMAGTEFEAAWVRLTIDLKSARYFDTAELALRHYTAHQEGLNHVQHAAILDALNELVNTPTKGERR